VTDLSPSQMQDAATGVISEATRDGLDPVEQLMRRGLLLTEIRLMQLRVEAMDQIINMIDQTPAHRVLEPGMGNLAEDYRKALVSLLEDLAAKAREKWFKK